MFDVVPRLKLAELPASLRVTLLLGPAVKEPEKPPTLFELTKLAVTESVPVESVELTAKLVAVNEPVPVSVMVGVGPAPS